METSSSITSESIDQPTTMAAVASGSRTRTRPLMLDCEICCEELVKPVSCARCDYKVCVACTERFLLDLNAGVQCMNCKQPWSRDFMAKTFTLRFLDGPFKEHRKVLLMDIEKGLMPETQPYAEHAKVMEGLHAKMIQDKARRVKAEHRQAELDQMQVGRPLTLADLRQNAEIQKEIDCAKVDIMMYRAAKALIFRPDGAEANGQTQRRTFVKPCPATGCRGFLSSQWNCGLCHTKVCSKCHEIKVAGEDEDHVCNEDIVKTVQLMAADSKPCPKCGEMITRISGCPQMFHTPLSGGCGAIFDWNTLRISDTNNVHNPHWFEYQRKLNNGVVPRTEDNNCNTMPSPSVIVNVCVTLYKDDVKMSQFLSAAMSKMLRWNAHIQHVMLPQYQRNNVADNRDLRIQYLLDNITEERLKINILKREKDREKSQEYGQILQMYLHAARDIAHRFVKCSSQGELCLVFAEFKNLVQYTNASFVRVQTLFKSAVTLHICETDFNIKSVSKAKPKAKAAAA